MHNEKSNHFLRVSRIVWAGTLLIWVLSEYAVMCFQIDRHLYRVGSMQFYYRPLTMTLPLMVGFGTLRRLEKALVLRGLDDEEQLSRGFGFVTLIFYLGITATVIEYCLRLPK
jgi:hypothetical protein